MKNLKKFLSFFVAALLLFAAYFYYLFNIKEIGGDEILVLNYHQINKEIAQSLTVRPGNFSDELDYLIENGYHTITVKQLAAHLKDGAPLPEKPVLITFDDGYIDNYTDAFPLLKERQMTALIFLITDYIGTQKNHLTWPQIHEMRNYGIEFGSHTLSHAELSAKDLDDARYQLETSQAVFRWQFGENVSALAYPCGTYDEKVEKIVKEAGYELAFTIDYGTVRRGDNIYALKRVPIFGDMENELGHFELRVKRIDGVAFLYAVRSGLRKLGLDFLADEVPIP